MRKDLLYFLSSAVTLFFASCNLSDFQTENLAKPSGLNPVVYRPVSSGTYLVKDYTIFPWAGNTPVTVDSLKFKPIAYPLDSMKMNTSGTDSMVVIIKTVNETPMKYRYKLSFKGTSMDSGSKLLNAATIDQQGFVIEASKDSLEYQLNSNDVKSLGSATQFDLSITLYQPAKGPVVANVLKSSQISFRIGFRAPVNLFKFKL
jgi:hypothetical protein